MIAESNACGVDEGEQLMDEVRIRRDDFGDSGEVNIRSIDLLQEPHARERVAREFSLVQNGWLAEEIALKEDVSKVYCLLEFLLSFDFFRKQTDVTRQYLTHLLALFG